MLKHILIFLFLITLNSCSKDKPIYIENEKIDPYKVYKEAFSAFEKNEFFFANKKFEEAELNFLISEYAAKASLMASFSLYMINFYDEAIINLERHIKKYPADKNIIYAEYLICLIYFEQINDEKKDIEPLMLSRKKINLFLKKYENTEYAFDLKFKKDLIENQLAAKEIYIANYYIKTQAWTAAIKRFKNVLNNYSNTEFIEEALFRLVEIHYYLGLEGEAKKYAATLGYNYNSSEWFQMSYKLLNKDYKIPKPKSKDRKKFLERFIELIK